MASRQAGSNQADTVVVIYVENDESDMFKDVMRRNVEQTTFDQHSGNSGSQPMDKNAAILALSCSALWGGTVVAIRFSVDTFPPVGLAGIRFSLAFLFMLGWCYFRGTSFRVQRNQIIPIIFTAILLFIQIALLNVGSKSTSASHGTVFINSYPLFVALLSHYFTVDDRLSANKSIGLLIASVGMGVVVLDPFAIAGNTTMDREASFQGDIWVLASAALLGVKTVFIKRTLNVIEPGKLLLWHELLAVVMFVSYSWLFETWDGFHFTLAGVLGVLYQGVVVGGFCFAAWTSLLQRHAASQLVVFSFATPIFGVLASYLLRGDPMTLSLITGTMAVVFGIFLVTTGASTVREHLRGRR